MRFMWRGGRACTNIQEPISADCRASQNLYRGQNESSSRRKLPQVRDGRILEKGDLLSMEIQDIFGGNGGSKEAPIPAPNATLRTSDDTGELTAEDVRGIICNPIYAGVSPFPAMVSDETWVRSAAVFISGEGSEQFLVNLLYVLRMTYENLGYGPQGGTIDEKVPKGRRRRGR